MLSFVLLLVRLAAADSVPAGPGTAAARLEPPVIVVHRQPGVPVVALRLSVLANDPPGYAGAGHIIQHLLYPTLLDRVGRVGGTAQIQRTADAIVYSVMGPAGELSYLARALLATLESPDPPADAVLRVDRELREERLAEWETAAAHARSVLRAQLFPADISAAGTDRSATRFSRANLPAIWSQIYRPERVSVLAVGDVFLADVQREFAELPESRSAPLQVQRDSVVLGSLAPPAGHPGLAGERLSRERPRAGRRQRRRTPSREPHPGAGTDGPGRRRALVDPPRAGARDRGRRARA